MGVPLACLLAGALIIQLVVCRILRRFVTAWAKRTEVAWDDALIQHRVIHRGTHLLPGAFLLLLGPVVLEAEPALWLRKITLAYMSIMAVSALCSLVSALHTIYQQRPHAKGRSLKGVVQMVQILLFVCGVIFALSALTDASPWKFLSGLGALSAVLMLVFKDSILGLVASVQVSANDSVRVGDWVEMPKYGADGNIIDVTLSSVKIQNFDNTISTIPTYALVADPVKNWRGMQESGGRRIKRSVHIDMHTVRFCDDEMLDRFSQFSAVADYMKGRREEVADWNTEHQVDTAIPVNGRRLTNLGVLPRLPPRLPEEPSPDQRRTHLPHSPPRSLRQRPPHRVVHFLYRQKLDQLRRDTSRHLRPHSRGRARV